MKSVSKAFMSRQAQKTAKAEFLRQYEEMRCETFKQNVDDITRQAVAMVICALAMHGYGAKRLNRLYEWILDILNFPAFFGKKLTTSAAEKKCEELGIDLSRIHVEVEVIENGKS